MAHSRLCFSKLILWGIPKKFVISIVKKEHVNYLFISVCRVFIVMQSSSILQVFFTKIPTNTNAASEIDPGSYDDQLQFKQAGVFKFVC